MCLCFPPFLLGRERRPREGGGGNPSQPPPNLTGTRLLGLINLFDLLRVLVAWVLFTSTTNYVFLPLNFKGAQLSKLIYLFYDFIYLLFIYFFILLFILFMPPPQ